MNFVFRRRKKHSPGTYAADYTHKTGGRRFETSFLGKHVETSHKNSSGLLFKIPLPANDLAKINEHPIRHVQKNQQV
jgi:hypothetical protein